MTSEEENSLTYATAESENTSFVETPVDQSLSEERAFSVITSVASVQNNDVHDKDTDSEENNSSIMNDICFSENPMEVHDTENSVDQSHITDEDTSSQMDQLEQNYKSKYEPQEKVQEKSESVNECSYDQVYSAENQTKYLEKKLPKMEDVSEAMEYEQSNDSNKSDDNLSYETTFQDKKIESVIDVDDSVKSSSDDDNISNAEELIENVEENVTDKAENITPYYTTEEDVPSTHAKDNEYSLQPFSYDSVSQSEINKDDTELETGKEYSEEPVELSDEAQQLPSEVCFLKFFYCDFRFFRILLCIPFLQMGNF